MFRFLSSLRPTNPGASRRRPAPAPRRARLNVESLEDRFLPSVSPLLPRPILSPALRSQAAPAANVPNLQGVSFYLSTTSNPYAGIVTVVSETPFSNIMKITGTWVDETRGGGKNHFSGAYYRDSLGSVWIDITDGTNVLIAKLTSVPYNTAVSAAVNGYYYNLDGSLMTPSGSSHVTGWGQPLPPMNAPPY